MLEPPSTDPCQDKDAQLAVLVELLGEVHRSYETCGSLEEAYDFDWIDWAARVKPILADIPVAARELLEERERYRKALKLAEWGTEGLCGACEYPGQHHHEPGCLVANALAEAE